MKMLSIVSSFYPYRGGSGLGHYDLLSRLVKYGHDITVLTYNYGDTDKTVTESLAGMKVVRLSCWARDNFITIPRPSLTNIKTFMALVNKRYDLIYTRARYSPPTSIGVLVAIFKHIPHLHTEVAPPLPFRRRWYSGKFAYILDKTLGKWILKHSTCVAVSRAAMNSMSENEARNVHLIYNGIDRDIFYPVKVL